MASAIVLDADDPSLGFNNCALSLKNRLLNFKRPPFYLNDRALNFSHELFCLNDRAPCDEMRRGCFKGIKSAAFAPLNPPIWGDFESQNPPNWGAGGRFRQQY
jgi:hypothetical protein